MKIDFYYWGFQCPINEESVILLKNYQNKFNIDFYDVTNNFEMTMKMNMYFPFLTVINNKWRYHRPVSRELMEELLINEHVNEQPYIIELAKQQLSYDIIPLTYENAQLIAEGCSLSNCKKSCLSKSNFLSGLNQQIYGFINVNKNRVLGGAEYVNSVQVPYNIPHESDAAFITCVYHSSEKYDYKSAPLLALEEYLKTNYKKVYAITDELSTFPNGDLKWFLEKGYKDKEIVYVEDGYCTLHLVEKLL